MATDSVTQCQGLITQYNSLSIGKGALAKANDCVIRRENVIESRRGYAVYGSVPSAPSKLMVYSKRNLIHNGTQVHYDNGSGTYTAYPGTFTAPTGYRMRSVEASSNLYITTDAGVKVFTDLAGTAARKAGMPRMLDPGYALNAAGTGFLPTAYQCSYRVTLQRTDANSNVITGYPSNRMWVTNSSGVSKNVDVTAYLPSEAAVGDVVQVWRTVTISGVSSDISGDECGLVYQYALTSSDITAKSITFTDSVIDALLGAKLYTSPSQQGIAQANDRPPLCKDMALFKSAYMFYSNTSTKQRLNFTLIGTTGLMASTTGDITSGSPTIINIPSTSGYTIGMAVVGTGIPAGTLVSGIPSGTSITLSANATATTVGVALKFCRSVKLSGVNYFFGPSEVTSGAGAPMCQVSTTGTVAIDIAETARSLTRVINRYASSTVYAYYQSGPDDLPGIMMAEEQGIGGSAFTLAALDTTSAGMFSPQLPVSPATTAKYTSSAQVQQNGLSFSKFQEFEHVPALNYFLVGPASNAILRIVALRDALVIITESGVYRLTGDSPSSFNITALDLTVFCKSLNSVAVLSNQCIFLSNQGVVSANDTGIAVISRDIEPSILPLLTFTGIADNTSAFSYESDRSYYISTMSSSGDSGPSQTYVYNVFTKCWVRHSYPFVDGIVETSTDRMYFAKPSDTSVYKERKSFDDTDYADPEYAVTITALGTNTVTFTLATTTPKVGWTIVQGSSDLQIISLTNLGTSYTATLSDAVPGSWTTGGANVFPSVGMDVEWRLWNASAPGTLKQVREFQLKGDPVQGNNNPTSIILTFRSNFDDVVDSQTVTTGAARWGSGAWGTMPWGGQGDSYTYRTYVPQNKQYCEFINFGFQHPNAREKVSIAGYAVHFEMVSERAGK